MTEAILNLLIKWSGINSHSYNLAGLELMREEIKKEFLRLRDSLPGLKLDIRELDLKEEEYIDSHGKIQKRRLGKALSIRKLNAKPGAVKILLGGHYDTVFPLDSDFRSAKFIDEDKKILNGPGVADLKGGILVIIKALEEIEQSPCADKILWEVFLNPDEEIGSPGSAHLLEEAAQRNDIGLLYEPSLENGSLAYKRKGSGNFTLIVRGKSAHVGRDFGSGMNAILALAKLIEKINALNQKYLNIIINIGRIEGGGPLNVVPDLAIAKFNIRIDNNEDEEKILTEIKQVINDDPDRKVQIELYGKFNRKVKDPDIKTQNLFNLVIQCGKELGLDIKTRDTGGCCDGNNLATAGLANVDTLGVRGGAIHSSQEYVIIESLPERIKLTVSLLKKLTNHASY
jgi:glutamate carboxypeptidase